VSFQIDWIGKSVRQVVILNLENVKGLEEEEGFGVGWLATDKWRDLGWQKREKKLATSPRLFWAKFWAMGA
jgi:hypothetical protein